MGLDAGCERRAKSDSNTCVSSSSQNAMSLNLNVEVDTVSDVLFREAEGKKKGSLFWKMF